LAAGASRALSQLGGRRLSGLNAGRRHQPATGTRSIGHNAAIAVGSTVALLGLLASPISGSSMNPARTLEPGIVGVNFAGWWAYVFGNLIGVIIAVSLIALVRGMPDKAERSTAQGGGGMTQ
jgi:aquaporin Z